MKKTTHYTGHRWTTDEIRKLMKLWVDGESPEDIAAELSVGINAVLKHVQRLRREGIPLPRRKKGHVSGRSNEAWTQGEVEYLLRRRQDKATSEQIATELGRSINGVSAMIASLRKEGVPVAMRGSGVRRLWDTEALKGVAMHDPDLRIIELARKDYAEVKGLFNADLKCREALALLTPNQDAKV